MAARCPKSTASVKITGIAPYEVPGYAHCLKANIQFNFELAAYANNLPLTLLGRKTVSGNMVAFFTLGE
jgi:hypothetical protein